MGRSFANVSICNLEQRDSKAFVLFFLQKMKAAGYTVCDAAESAVQYVFRFSENGRWITADASDFDNNEAAAAFAKLLGTECVQLIVSDSDYAEFALYAADGSKQDRFLLGGEESNGNGQSPSEAAWRPLLVNGVSWADFVGVARASYTWVEEGVSWIAKALGMARGQLLFSADTAVDDNSTLFLCFKKITSGLDCRNPHTKSVKGVFQDVFGAALAPRNYQLIKCRYPFYVSLVGQDFIKIIGLEHDQREQQFSIKVGVATLYRQEITLHEGFRLNDCWLRGLSEFEKIYTNALVYNREIDYFRYQKDDSKSVYQAMERALETVKNVVQPVFEKLKTLDDVLDYLCIFEPGFINFGTPEKQFSDASLHDGLICFLLDDPTDAAKKRAESTRVKFRALEAAGAPGFTAERCAEMLKQLDQGYLNWLQQIETVLYNNEFYTIAKTELERRKQHNLEIIKSYGLL